MKSTIKRKMFRDRLAEGKIRAIAWFLDWQIVEESEVDRLMDEETPVTILDWDITSENTFCPVRQEFFKGEKRVIRYRKFPVRCWWTPWLLFRLGLRIGKRVHRGTKVHVIPRANCRSIVLGWIEYDPGYGY